MAKIGKVPSARELIETKPPGAHGQYGPRFTWHKLPGSAELREGAFVFANAGDGGAGMYPLEKLDKPHLYVPYVNAFLRDHGKVVKRNVKANTYRLIDMSAADPIAAAVSGAGTLPYVEPLRFPSVAAIPVVVDEAGFLALADLRKKMDDMTAELTRSYPLPTMTEPVAVPFGAIPDEDYIGAMVGAFAAKVKAEPEPEPEPASVPEPEPEAIKVIEAAPVFKGERPNTDDVVGLERLPLEEVVITKAMVTVGDIVTTPANYSVLADAWKLRQAGQPGNVLITGPAGAAKTALARSFAASIGLPFLKVDGGSIRSADDWSGMVRQDANTKTWAHHWSPFAQVLRRGEPALILIDEINRTESPQALNALLGLLDMTGQLLVPDANDVLTLPAGIMVVATANIGPEFIGTLPLDGAVRQRFGFGVRMEFLPQATEAKLLTRLTGLAAAVATRLVKVADMQRQNRSDMQLYPSGSVISTRLLLDVARRIATCDTDPREALWATLMGQFETGDEAALTVCVETQFPSPDLAALPSMDDDNDADPFTIKVK